MLTNKKTETKTPNDLICNVASNNNNQWIWVFPQLPIFLIKSWKHCHHHDQNSDAHQHKTMLVILSIGAWADGVNFNAFNWSIPKIRLFINCINPLLLMLLEPNKIEFTGCEWTKMGQKYYWRRSDWTFVNFSHSDLRGWNLIREQWKIPICLISTSILFNKFIPKMPETTAPC